MSDPFNSFGAGTDCCPGECEVCDFVEKCEKDPYSYGVEEKSLVFDKFWLLAVLNDRVLRISF